jgi:hypothetical protein
MEDRAFPSISNAKVTLDILAISLIKKIEAAD